MKVFTRILEGVVTLFLFSLVGPMAAFAATTPALGMAGTFGILANTFTRNIGVTTIAGDLGYTTLSGSGSQTVTGTTHVADGTYNQAGIDQGTALSALASWPCTFTFIGALHLASDTTHGPVGVYTPGVYCSTGAMDIGGGGTITLDGNGTYIFRSGGAFDSTANSRVVLINSASSCDVFWSPTAAATLGANSTFAGTIIDAAGITIGNSVSWNGRALAFGGTVTADTDTIASTCAVSTPSESSRVGTINVVKTVINDNGGTKTVADFPLFVNGIPVASGITNSFPAPSSAYTVTETSDPNYIRTFSGDCDANGQIGLNPGYNKFCIITNNDIGAPVVTPPVPPLIDVVKVPSPLALPSGPGVVSYTYTLRNIGTVPVTNITMVGDTCSPIVLATGDTNADAKLDLNETWIYRCSTTLTETHTNIVTATGWANGISAVDIAGATVVVGVPTVPPLIHVTKVPSPLALFAKGGMVTYTEKINNPGTVALSNVRLTDDKCSPLKYISGDINKDSKLDSTETWTYTCQTNLTKTTTNTAIAEGEANGLSVRDLALATVVVATAVPKLPDTGLTSDGGSVLPTAILVGIAILVSASLAIVLKKRWS